MPTFATSDFLANSVGGVSCPSIPQLEEIFTKLSAIEATCSAVFKEKNKDRLSRLNELLSKYSACWKEAADQVLGHQMEKSAQAILTAFAAQFTGTADESRAYSAQGQSVVCNELCTNTASMRPISMRSHSLMSASWQRTCVLVLS